MANFIFNDNVKVNVYSILLGDRTFRFVWLGVATEINEAIFLSKQALLRESSFTDEEVNNMTVITTTDMSMDYLSATLLKMGVLESTEEIKVKMPKVKEKKTKKDLKNELMKEIIVLKDKKLYKKNLKSFNKIERAYLLDKLNENTNKQ